MAIADSVIRGEVLVKSPVSVAPGAT
jgi:hypothetical protein